MCYSSSKDFGWGTRKESGRKPETKQDTQAETPVETPEPRFTAQDYSFWAFPNWRRTPSPRTPTAERSKERV